MTEQQLTALVRAAIEEELTREGGALDRCREAALHFVLAAIDVKFKNLREELGLTGLMQ
jgi:hypothetical protein